MQRFIQRLVKKLSPKRLSQPSPSGPTSKQILSRDQHGVSRSQIDKHALDVLYGLKRAGYEAYLVGGGVRDLLLGLEPKDFDVVTNAEPEAVKAVFKNKCRLIGRRFRLAHVRFGRQIIEVATFRGDSEASEVADKPKGRGRLNHTRAVDGQGRLLRDNVFGGMDEDVWRRDFTVNSLYYNIRDFSITDYAGGLDDIKAGVIRLIGDPETRYREDPVRMIRAVRFAAKLGFEIEPGTRDPIYDLAPLLKDVSHARMFEEVLKLFHSGVAVQVFEKLRHFGLFAYLFPQTEQMLSEQTDGFPRMLVIEALKSTDDRIRHGKGVNPAFLFAAMLWEPMVARREQLLAEDLKPQDATFAAASDVLEWQRPATAVPRRFIGQVKDIWNLQYRLPRYQGDKAQKLVTHPRFRAAYDFLGVRVSAGAEELKEVFDWWTHYQTLDGVEQVAYANQVKKPGSRRRRPRRNRNPYRKRANPAPGKESPATPNEQD
jgi:poly(A) polymerase